MADKFLYELLRDYGASGVCPMHMPGHKRNTDMLGSTLPYREDITEIEGFDNLQNPEGVLKETAALAAALYGSRRAFLSVNGSTGAILAAVKACVKPYDKIIMARACHKSVYNAVCINMLRPVYVASPADEASGILGGVPPAKVRAALDAHPDASLVIVTSPTYEGVGSDIRAIAETAHAHGVPLLVDAAHGAHLGFSPAFGESAVQAGADLVVMSLHKTLPALTQCALLHLRGGLVREAALQSALNMFQTSSPSYVLMASSDACLRLLKRDGAPLFRAYESRLAAFGERMKGLKTLRVLCTGNDAPQDHPAFFRFDPGKLVILTRFASGLSGPGLARVLRERYLIETEMAAPGYTVAMTSICDADENFARLADALLETDAGLSPGNAPSRMPAFAIPDMAFPPCDAAAGRGGDVPLPDAAGRVSLEYVWAYPPGIPLIAPGEVVPTEFPDLCRNILQSGVSLRSTGGNFPRVIRCATETS